MGKNAASELDELKDFILNELIKKDSLLGKMLSPDNQLKLAEGFAKSLTEANVSMSSIDVKNKDTMDTLKFGCRAQAAQMLDPSYKPDMKLILSPLTKNEEKEEEKEANTEKNIFKMLKSMLELKLKQKNLTPTKEQEQELEMKLKELARSLSKGKSGPTMMKGCMDAMIRESVERKSLYGGIDPEKGSGQERAVVQGVQGGNQFARQDLSNIGDTFMATYDKADSGQPDPVGSRISSAVNMLANDITPASEPELGVESRIKSPGSTPKLKPPGSE